MRHYVHLMNRLALHGLIAILGLLPAGFLSVACSDESAALAVFPFEGAPVTVVVDGGMLVVANNTASAVYLRVFPTDILPVIEWAPCIAPETCPEDQRIASVSEKRIKLRDIAREQTVSITVFWWFYHERAPGASVPPMKMEEISVPLP